MKTHLSKFFVLTLAVIALLFVGHTVRAVETTTSEITFPIADLGNCASKEECRTYCNQPANRTACINFSHSRKLFEAKNFLNCRDLGSCRDFCARPENKNKCDELMRRTRELKIRVATHSANIVSAFFVATQAELSCSNEESCTIFCSQTSNILRCQNFLRRHLLFKEEKMATPPGLLRPKPAIEFNR